MAIIHKYYNIGDEILPINGLDSQRPTVLSISETENGKYGEVQPHSHTYLEFFYFTKGTGFIEAGGKKTPLKTNDILLVNAGVIHQQYSLNNSNPLTFYSLSLDNIKLLSNDLNVLSKEPFLHLHFNSSKNFARNTIKLIINELSNIDSGSYALIASYISQLFIKTVRLFEENGQLSKPVYNHEKHNSIVNKAKTFIEENYKKEITLDDLASKVFISKNYLIYLFKKTYNLSPMRYLNIVRLENAKELIIKTDLPVNEIAYQTGFNNPSYFAELFKKYIGTTPTTYRKITQSHD